MSVTFILRQWNTSGVNRDHDGATESSTELLPERSTPYINRATNVASLATASRCEFPARLWRSAARSRGSKPATAEYDTKAPYMHSEDTAKHKDRYVSSTTPSFCAKASKMVSAATFVWIVSSVDREAICTMRNSDNVSVFRGQVKQHSCRNSPAVIVFTGLKQHVVQHPRRFGRNRPQVGFRNGVA